LTCWARNGDGAAPASWIRIRPPGPDNAAPGAVRPDFVAWTKSAVSAKYINCSGILRAKDRLNSPEPDGL